ncbi:MAG: NosD domain-containing protein, partial [Vicingaceae bacterium]|nr:NosD domain-containing protein [Vicingaceae bacterium]
VFMGATSLRTTDNTRFLFISNGTSLYRYKVTSSGISYDNYSFLLTDASSQGLDIRSELEVAEINNNGNITYRLAIPYSRLNGTYPFNLEIIDLDHSGNIIPLTEQLIEFQVFPFGALTALPHIKGLEFSPNGRYLYITHTSDPGNPDNAYPFKIYDVDDSHFEIFSGNTGLMDPLTGVSTFYQSLIELGTDGKLYFANNFTMATITNPDDPSNLVWNGSAIPLPNYLLSKPTDPEDDDAPIVDLSLQVYLLPDQVDGENYTTYLNTGESCCKTFSSFDISSEINNEFSTNSTWTDGNNPIGILGNEVSPIYIKDNLIIKNGTYISIDGMQLHFAADAQLIIEDGAKLFLHNSTLTADTRCSSEAMWHGIEIWGKGTNTYQPLVSGSLISSNSTISNATEAITNYRHILTHIGKPIIGSEVQGTSGGIIQLNGVTLLNNQYDVNMRPFQSLQPSSNNVIDDHSQFINSNFITSGPLNNPYRLPKQHVFLNNVNGISFLGCKFENLTTGLNYGYAERGIGIEALNSKFTVNDYNSITSEFNNLYRGINAQSWNSLKTTQITNTTFYNIWRGVYLRRMDVSNVSNNTFDVGESLQNNPGYHPKDVSYGLYFDNCTGYKIENNIFNTTFNGYLGLGIVNSGSDNNEVYKNSFNNLVVGTQAQGINGEKVFSSKHRGLAFKCNTYTNISDYDILVSSGNIKSYQGSC